MSQTLVRMPTHEDPSADPDPDYVPAGYDELPPDDDAPESGRAPSPPPGPSVLSPGDVLAQWRDEGPLVHEPTGIPALDELTGGGPVYGTRWYILGAPDAGKTALLVQLAHTYAQRGIAVGLLAVDEEPTDIVTRLAQRIGYSRRHCEIRDGAVLDGIGEALGDLPIRLYDSTWTIELAAAELAKYAGEHDTRAVLLVDSLQTVTCDRELAVIGAGGRELSTREAVTARAQALRAVATGHRIIAIATSEMNRAAYRTADAAAQTDDLASAAESRAVEYSGRVVLALRSVPGESDLVEIRLAKNKHGPRTTADGEPRHLYLRMDRPSQTMAEAAYEPEPAEDREASREAERAARTRDMACADAAHVAAIAVERDGPGVREVRGAMRSRIGAAGRERVDAALELLGPAVVRVRDGRSVRLHLDGRLVPEQVLARMSPDDRARVEAARPPGEEVPS